MCFGLVCEITCDFELVCEINSVTLFALITCFEILCKTIGTVNGCVRQLGGLNGVMRHWWVYALSEVLMYTCIYDFLFISSPLCLWLWWFPPDRTFI